MDDQLPMTESIPAWALASFTRQKVPNDVPTEDEEELSSRNPQADHLRKFIRSPRSMPEHPSLDAPLHGLQVNGLNQMGFHRHESLLLEGWLNLMLKRPSPPVSSRYSFSLSVDNDDTGLTEYNLSREQLAKYGLSQAEVERGYRMLYVYSAGCYDVIKELCIHSLGKSFLVGCFWRAFIRLCEEQSKIGLRVEIADLVDQKKKAQDELRVTRGCLNGALDRLSLEFMKQIKLSESLAEETAMQDSRHQEVLGLQDRLQQSNTQVQELAKKVAQSEQARVQAVAQAMDATRIMKRAKLDEHNASMNEAKKIDEVDALKAKLVQLKDSLALEKEHGKKLQQSQSRIEAELLREERKAKENEANLLELSQLKNQVGEKNGQVASLEQDNKAIRKDCRNLKIQQANFEAKILCFDKESADCAVALAEMQHLVNEKTRICEEKMLESALLGNEVQSWVEGNEKLLAEQEKLVLEILHVRDLLAQKGSEKLEATQSFHSLVACKEKTIHAMTLGVVHLVRIAQTRPRFVGRPAVNTRDHVARAKQVDKAVSCTSAAILYDLLGPSGEEVFKLRDDLHKMEGSSKEERDKRSWLEKQTGDVFKLLTQQKSELSDADQRVANLALEKRTAEHLLNLAEDEIRRLRGENNDLRLVNEQQSRTVDALQHKTAETAAQQSAYSAQIFDLRASLAEEMEARKSFEKIGAELKEQVKYLEWCLKDMTDNYNNTLQKKNKWKGRANDNATIIAELRAKILELKTKFDPLFARNRDLQYMIKDEKQLREEAERILKEVLAENNSLKLELKGLESLLKAAESEKTAITRRVTHLNVENEYLREERTREMIIREILQNEVDALRLLTESLKIKLSASHRQAEGKATGSEGVIERLEDRGAGKAKEIDDEVQKLECNIEALLATRVAEEQKLQIDIHRRLSKEHAESRLKDELEVSSLGAKAVNLDIIQPEERAGGSALQSDKRMQEKSEGVQI